MHFSIELVALVATAFSAVTAAPVPAPEANAEPHNFFRNRHGNGHASPHFVSVGSWKRDGPAQAAEVQKRQEPYGPEYGYAYGYDGRIIESDRVREDGRHEDGGVKRPDPPLGLEGVGHRHEKINEEEFHRVEKGKGHREKEHREKEHREKEHREKEHKEKEHKEKEHREKGHTEKEIIVDPKVHKEKEIIVDPKLVKEHKDVVAEPKREKEGHKDGHWVKVHKQEEKSQRTPAVYRYGKAFAKAVSPGTVAFVEAAYAP